MILLNNENSAEHWKFIDVKDKVVLDLGCGRWNKVERVEDEWLTTPEHFVSHGAKRVIAVDIDPLEIDWFNNNFKDNNIYEFLCMAIKSKEDIIKLYNIYNPDCVKCDIETNEKYLLELSREQFCSIKNYYIETHGDNLYLKFLQILSDYNYHISEQIDLTHTNGYCKVLFATKK